MAVTNVRVETPYVAVGTDLGEKPTDADVQVAVGTWVVAEVLMLIASEGYGLAPTGFGGKAALAREESAKLPSVTDKAQVIDHLNKGFAHAKAQIEGIDSATLTGKRRLFGSDRNIVEIATALGGDMHEHLGQLIAYARTNHIVPPWSK